MISSIDPTVVLAIASGLVKEGASMEINSADLKFEAVSAASNEGLLQSAVKPADPSGSMGAPTAILIKERRGSAAGFEIFGMIFLYGFVMTTEGKGDINIRLNLIV